MLIHAIQRWPEAVSPVLWPFAITAATGRHNLIDVGADGKSPMERLANLGPEELDIDSFHTCGCPMYILNHRIQQTAPGPPKMGP